VKKPRFSLSRAQLYDVASTGTIGRHTDLRSMRLLDAADRRERYCPHLKSPQEMSSRHLPEATPDS